MIIAIDGTSGSGKSTISKSLSKKLNMKVLNTGMIYRLVALWSIVNFVEDNVIENFIDKIKNDIKIEFDDFKQIGFLNNADVTDKLMENDISQKSSHISQIVKIRDLAQELQEKIASKHDIIVEGRDITTVVFPEAEFKFFLISSYKSRAERRFLQLKNTKGLSKKSLAQSMFDRDKLDITRSVSPLKIGDSTILINSSNNTAEQTLEKFLFHINKKGI